MYLHSGKPIHIADPAATGTMRKVQCRGTTKDAQTIQQGITTQLIITNTDGANGLRVSFDGGTNYYTIAANQEKTFDVAVEFFHVQSTSSSTTWKALAILRAAP